jgi:hypothetical protein
MTAPARPEGVCRRCGQTRPLFVTLADWVTPPVWLCTVDWQALAEARYAGTFLDWADAFDNATDDQIAQQLAHPKETTR